MPLFLLRIANLVCYTSLQYIGLRKSQRYAKPVLDYKDMNKLFQDKKFPVLRTIVKDLTEDPQKRFTFLEHLKEVQKSRQQRRIHESPYGTNHVETNQNKNFDEWLVTHQVEKNDYFNSLLDKQR